MDEKYYTPSEEDLRVGYECEKYEKFIGSSGKWSKEVIQVKEIETESGIIYDAIDIGIIVRTKYLDAQDIESEGWKFENIEADPFGFIEDVYRLDKEYPDITWAEPMGVYWIMKVTRMDKNNSTPKVDVVKTEWGGFAGITVKTHIFKGECKSINELRTIQKWLGIKK